jgi:hypothetical protein
MTTPVMISVELIDGDSEIALMAAISRLMQHGSFQAVTLEQRLRVLEYITASVRMAWAKESGK